MSSFHQPLPFGAELLGDGRARFRLWAPGARSLTLLVDASECAMTAQPDGWWQAEQPAPAGTRYSYLVDGRTSVPDPASRLQADDVHGDSIVVDPRAYRWKHPDWRGRPWHEMVVMELHVGCCGGFAGVARMLPRLSELGITAVELMPIADFPGRRNWGYDGVLPFAPDAAYGTPDELKALVDAAHGLGLCIYLDVVYNHFGPDGNYLHVYAPSFFDEGQSSPWGAAIDFARPEVRQFFTTNALFWLQEYRFDGLRFDAVHAISRPDWLDEMATTVRREVGPQRIVHLVLENERNAATHLAGVFDAQWNDDGHNSLHVLLTGEHEGYYGNYADRPIEHLARCLAEGFAYQGEVPPASGHDEPRGEPSGHLPPMRFVLFLQNHDQVGNRALGERLITLVDEARMRAVIVLQLLCPHIPLLFMGEEFGSRAPFLFFTDFHDELADAVREGRRREFSAFAAFASEDARKRIPDPNAPQTFEASCPDFAAADAPANARWTTLYTDLLRVRRERLVPFLEDCEAIGVEVLGEQQLLARWRLGARTLLIALNLGEHDIAVTAGSGELLYESVDGCGPMLARGVLAARSASAWLQPEAA